MRVTSGTGTVGPGQDRVLLAGDIQEHRDHELIMTVHRRCFRLPQTSMAQTTKQLADAAKSASLLQIQIFHFKNGFLYRENTSV